jgi:hypothetical protein
MAYCVSFNFRPLVVQMRYLPKVLTWNLGKIIDREYHNNNNAVD